MTMADDLTVEILKQIRDELKNNGAELRGHIEWYDRGCIKVNREGNANLLVYKHAIKYMYKQEEETPAG